MEMADNINLMSQIFDGRNFCRLGTVVEQIILEHSDTFLNSINIEDL